MLFLGSLRVLRMGFQNPYAHQTFFRWTMELHIGRRMIYIFTNLRFVFFQPIMITGNSMYFISVSKVKQMNSAFRAFKDSMLTFRINRIWRPMWKCCIEFIIVKDVPKFRETVRMYDKEIASFLHLTCASIALFLRPFSNTRTIR